MNPSSGGCDRTGMSLLGAFQDWRNTGGFRSNSTKRCWSWTDKRITWAHKSNLPEAQRQTDRWITSMSLRMRRFARLFVPYCHHQVHTSRPAASPQQQRPGDPAHQAGWSQQPESWLGVVQLAPVIPDAAHRPRPDRHRTGGIRRHRVQPQPDQRGKGNQRPTPATELMAPARKASPKATAACLRSKYAILTRARCSWSWPLCAIEKEISVG